MTGNNIVGDLIKIGNQDFHHNFKVLYASHFPLNVKKHGSFPFTVDRRLEENVVK